MSSSMMMISMAPVPSTPSLSSRFSTFLPHFSLSLPSTPNSKPRFQFLSLKSQPTTVTSLSLAADPRIRRLLAASFDEFESESDSDVSEQEESFESDPEPEEFGGQEVGKVSASGEYGRLYVGNLPYTMTSTKLAEVFGEAGRVINVEVVYDRVTDRSRGFAFVTMGSVDEANEAIRMFDGSQVGGRTVKVNFPEVPRGGEREVMGPTIRNSNRAFVDSPHKIYAGNLGWGLSSQGLREAFSGQPGVLSAKVIYQKNSGRSRGFGFISFDSAEAAQSALDAMNGVDVDGRPLRLNIAAGRPNSTPSSYSEENVESSADSEELVSSISS